MSNNEKEIKNINQWESRSAKPGNFYEQMDNTSSRIRQDYPDYWKKQTTTTKKPTASSIINVLFLTDDKFYVSKQFYPILPYANDFVLLSPALS